MTFLAPGRGAGGGGERRGGGEERWRVEWVGGRDPSTTQAPLLHDFNVLNRHRKSRAHLKNTLRVPLDRRGNLSLIHI